MGRPKKYEDRRQVTFSVDEPEYKWIELQAAGNVSQWCREQVLADMSKPDYVVMEGKKLRMTKTPPAESIEVDRCHPKEAKSARRN